jgi:hypothetical protein
MAYGGSTPNTFGLNPQQADARNRITQALMRIANPPPGGTIAPGTPPVTPQQPTQPVQGMQPTAGMMPQQPAGLGAAGTPTGSMGPIGGPYQPGMALPGINPPGQLPQGMRPGGY